MSEDSNVTPVGVKLSLIYLTISSFSLLAGRSFSEGVAANSKKVIFLRSYFFLRM